MKTSIRLNRMRFFAYHGVCEQETIVGNQFEVNISIEADVSSACQSDNVIDTVNYASVFDLVKKEMQMPSKLIEHAAYRIAKKIRENYPQITTLEVRLAKINPPVEGEMACAEIVLSM